MFRRTRYQQGMILFPAAEQLKTSRTVDWERV